MKTKKRFIALAVSSALFLLVCNSCNQKKEFIDFETVQKNDIDTSQYKGFDFVSGKGEVWKMWDKVFRACMKSEIFDDPYYFGMTNTIDLGAITDKKHESVIRLIDTNVFSQAEINQMIRSGNPASCEYVQQLTMSLNVFLNSEFSVTGVGNKDINAELNLAISTAKSSTVKVDGWQKDELVTGVLGDILDETTDPKKLKFKKDLLTEGNLILVRGAKINGFSSQITTSQEISANLEAKLKEGVIASIGNTGAQAKFEYVNKTTISVTSTGDFYIFGQYMKGKKVNVKPTTSS
ncbi:hypothetical protein GEO21_11730 [Sphingobacterium faecium]|uniref:hypothetical protein n=1 Tax=Sphingobacterium faecium TaxID=34087 RepID=UPI00129219CA|nr:hypothetical protein [Sphingobacterium faecium]MQP28175.1 hypothetical protein [Sphingobacterium faecium]